MWTRRTESIYIVWKNIKMSQSEEKARKIKTYFHDLFIRFTSKQRFLGELAKNESYHYRKDKKITPTIVLDSRVLNNF